MEKTILENDFQGHIVWLCKGRYSSPVDFFTAIKRIWEIRFGLETDSLREGDLRYIANEMYAIVKQTQGFNEQDFQERLHKELVEGFYEGSAIRKVIWLYRGHLCVLKIKELPSKYKNLPLEEQVEKRYSTIVKLPKPKVRLFKKIIGGRGEFNDYENIGL